MTTQAMPPSKPFVVSTGNELFHGLSYSRETRKGWKCNSGMYELNGLKFKINEERHYTGWWTVEDRRSMTFSFMIYDSVVLRRRFRYNVV